MLVPFHKLVPVTTISSMDVTLQKIVTTFVAKGVVRHCATRMFVDIIRTHISKTRPMSYYQLTHCKLARCKVIKNLWRSSSNPHKHGSLHSYVSQLLIEIIKINSRVNPLHSARS